jgi:hypothetical protein
MNSIKLKFYLVFNKAMRASHWGKDSLFNKWGWGLTKINLKLVKDLYVRHETIKLLEKKQNKTSLAMIWGAYHQNHR